MIRPAVFVFVLAFGLETHLTHATEVSVNNTDNKLCLYANLMINFSVTYDVAGNKSETAVFQLPDKVSTDGSLCDNTSSTLKLSFGSGHYWAVTFSKSDKTYRPDLVVFTYNLNDSVLFPNATSNEPVSVTVALKDSENVSLDTCYSCRSADSIQTAQVKQTLWDVLIQAFVSGGIRSDNITMCAADLPTTTVAPTTHTSPVTTPAPLPPTTATPPLPAPTTGKYSVKTDVNSTACLKANFGLRFGFKVGQKYQEMNLDPNGTQSKGSCGGNISELVLSSSSITVMLTFTSEAKRFHLHAINVTAKTSTGAVFTEANSNLTLWEAMVGSSYMCNKEQIYNITDVLTLYTYELQVQPFGISKGVFSTAEECFLDSDLSFLVPIAVGVALSFLIILVLISYLIGRRKSRTGYQSV